MTAGIYSGVQLRNPLGILLRREALLLEVMSLQIQHWQQRTLPSTMDITGHDDGCGKVRGFDSARNFLGR